MQDIQLSSKSKKGIKKKLFIIAILLIIPISAKSCIDTNVFKVNNVQFHSDKIPKGSELKIVQISDLHSKVFGENNGKLILEVQKANPDIIVITGDLIDRRTANFSDVFDFIEKLTSINDHVFFVSGNHEWGNSGREDLLTGLEKRNVQILNNHHTQLAVNDITLNLVGIDDVSTNHEDMEDAFSGLQQETYTILLSHSPGVVDKYEGIPTDLILSGHTHGGQVRLPIIGAVVAPDEGFFPERVKGIYKTAENQYLYIDSGLGTSVAPIRFLNQSQLSVIEVLNNN